MATSTRYSNDALSQKIGKAFVVQYYRLLHEHPEYLHRFYSSSSTLMYDDPSTVVTGVENIAKRIEELSLKQRQVIIHQVNCHSTFDSSIVVQVCGEISSSSITDNQTPVMKSFIQTFVLAPTVNTKQKYYIFDDIFRYQNNIGQKPTIEQINDQNSPQTSKAIQNEVSLESVQDQSTTSSSSLNMKLSNNMINKSEQDATENKTNSIINSISSPTPAKEQKITDKDKDSAKPFSCSNTISKKEKFKKNQQVDENKSKLTTTTNRNKSKASNKKLSKSSGRSKLVTYEYPQNTNDYDDDSWYYGSVGETYFHTGYTDDQEIFVGNLSTQVTEEEIHELFRPYGHLLLIRIGNTGTQIGKANFAFVVCQSIEMAKAIITDHETLLKSHQINVEAKKRRPFPHTFYPTYPTAASPTNFQSSGYSRRFNQHVLSTSINEGGVVPRYETRRGRKLGT